MIFPFVYISLSFKNVFVLIMNSTHLILFVSFQNEDIFTPFDYKNNTCSL